MDKLVFGYEFEKDLYDKFSTYLQNLIFHKIITARSQQAGFIKELVNSLTSFSLKRRALSDTIYNNEFWSYIINSNAKIVNHSVFKNAPTKDIKFKKDNILSKNHHIMLLYKYYKEFIDVLVYEEKISHVNNEKKESVWTNFDVLVGSLRNKKQLAVCLEHNFYHTPCKNIDKDNLPSYIAIYQSKHYFKEDAGINYVAEVNNYEILPRYQIKEIPSNSKEEYYKFYVSKWKKLETKIDADFSGSIFLFTNLYLIKNALSVYELSFKSKEEFDLYNVIHDAVYKDTSSKVYEFLGNHFIFDDDTIRIYEGNNLIFKLTKNEYMKNNMVSFEKIKKCIFK